MQLDIIILSGDRSGLVINLGELSSHSSITSWVKENEALELRLEVIGSYSEAEIVLYDHQIIATSSKMKGVLFLFGSLNVGGVNSMSTYSLIILALQSLR
ncbi:hypothetical protein [Yersinia enterocolitica]|uniref:Uncharacterized protein n=1 Tax=Yersinia enterocolitica TaxID=630 RepID=A0ABM9RUN2_YEREN|nr:hypothetical protein [Yersinia enterocolitica]CND08233.1 Uncharacterised protein [Yersinia enterocolitica]CQD67083.1 Uncharacterised protein [Yersinia enterocolitica]CRX81291.1 Uncharacterised protein [Yersinia enterocolitica]